MKDYFDNSKKDNAASRRRSHGGGLRGAFRDMLNLESKRGAKLRFRLLCVLAIMFLVAFFLIRHYYPHQSGVDIEEGLKQDVFGPKDTGREILPKR